MNLNELNIVIAAYNRPESLLRLLNSLTKVKTINNIVVNLIISIDHSGKDEVFHIAHKYMWNLGEKTIIKHEKNLGLKAHILYCGDLTKKYKNVIVLEDDLYVSRYFLKYCLESILNFRDDNNIAGISLYNHIYNETKKLPFTAVKNSDSDVYYMQLPSSWGQIWSKNQWEEFREWLDKNKDFKTNDLPKNIANWPMTSWKKIFTAYMIDQNKYFVYPYESLSTNFGDLGVNFWEKSTRYQSPLLEYQKDYCFDTLDESKAVYDAFCENVRLNNIINLDSTICVDLYGSKIDKYSEYDYVLTTNKIDLELIDSYSLSLKPWELNISSNLKGHDIYLFKINNINFKRKFKLDTYMKVLEYFYPGLNIQKTIKVFLSRKNYISLVRKVYKNIKSKFLVK